MSFVFSMIEVDDLIAVLSALASEAGMQVTVKESLKGGVIAGVAAAAGGLVMGPPGLAIGKKCFLVRRL